MKHLGQPPQLLADPQAFHRDRDGQTTTVSTPSRYGSNSVSTLCAQVRRSATSMVFRVRS